MKTRGNPSGPGVSTTPHLQRPDIRMQPESCHHPQDPFAQGLGPYMEISTETRTPGMRRVLLALATIFLVVTSAAAAGLDGTAIIKRMKQVIEGPSDTVRLM